MSLTEVGRVIEAAHAVLTEVGSVLRTAGGDGLAGLLTRVDALVAAGSAARARIVLEASTRGEIEASSRASTVAWVRQVAPSLRQGGAGALAALTRVVAAANGPGLGAGGLDPVSPVGIVWAAVTAGACTPGLALDVLKEVDQLRAHLYPDAVPTVTTALLDLGREWGSAHMRRLRPALLAKYGVEGELDTIQERLAGCAHLSTPQVSATRVTEYTLALAPAQAIALEAALGPLSKPRPDPNTGERDPRPVGQRRAEALAAIVTAWANQHATERTPGTSGAVIHVTMPLEDLLARLGAGEVIGSPAAGTLLGAQTVRRLACDATLIPHVLGAAGESLDVGRAHRLFTPAQRHALILRDRHCTYPGCDIPAHWCRAHHLTHWADGGPTDLSNAALLCERHHGLVHARNHTATIHTATDDDGTRVDGPHVEWDLTPDSYARALERPHGPYCTGHRCRHTPHAPPTPLTLTELRDLIDARITILTGETATSDAPTTGAA